MTAFKDPVSCSMLFVGSSVAAILCKLNVTSSGAGIKSSLSTAVGICSLSSKFIT